MTKPELEAGIAEAWRQAYSVKTILRRFDFRHIRKLWAQSVIYLAMNLGYRKYAKGFSIFDEAIMTNNDDIPEGSPLREPVREVIL